MSDSTSKLLCYNKGCCQSFNPDENSADSCLFHPGKPVFHDAYKSWSCCKKKSTDFTEFLNFKGCTTSFHSNVKPAEPEKPKNEPLGKEEVIVYEAPKHTDLQRPNEDAPMIQLSRTITESLKVMLAKRVDEKPTTTNSTLGQIEIGTCCKNRGCKKVYSNTDPCNYHPGFPIFHEGLKFWSCCKKRTTDFEIFLQQVGCTNGSHAWIEPELKLIDCRYDFHQTGSHVIVSIYAKGCDPQKSIFEANAVKLRIYAAYGDAIFNKEFILEGVIDVPASIVTLAATKIEVKLKKAAPFNWKKLSLTAEERSRITQNEA